MGLLSSFTAFMSRVMKATKQGGLNTKDRKLLSRLLERTNKKNVILAKGILSALSVGGATKEDVEKFGNLLENAYERITNEKKPFSKKEEQEIADIFKKAFISEKAAKWFSNNLDELVATEIEDFIRGRQILPSKKTVRFESEAKPERKKTTV